MKKKSIQRKMFMKISEKTLFCNLGLILIVTYEEQRMMREVG
jgi:hypothetical protein